MADQNDKTSGELREAKRSSVIDQQLMNQPSSVKNDSLDDKDLDNQEESGGQNNQVDGNNSPESNSQAGEDYANVREQQNQARVEQENQENEGAEDSDFAKKSSPPNPMAIATSGALKGAWESLIESFGLSILYVDLHFLLNKIVGDKVFPKLGHEWVPKEIAKVGGDKAEEIGKKIEIFETGGCCAVNSCCLVALLMSLTPFMLVLYVYNNKAEAIQTMTQVVVDFVEIIVSKMLGLD
jgi:hypothetical protein